MTTNEMRSRVCKRANALYRNLKNSGWTKSAAFRFAWVEVKKEANSIKASDLKVGDVVRIELGTSGNRGNVTIVSIVPCAWGFNVKADNFGHEISFVAEFRDMFEKAVA